MIFFFNVTFLKCQNLNLRDISFKTIGKLYFESKSFKNDIKYLLK